MGVYDAVKDAVTIAQKADNIELYRALIDVQKECLDLIEENRNLKDEIRKLRENLDIDCSLVFINSNYYKKDDTSYAEPYCSVCWDSNKKLIRMHDQSAYGYRGTYLCKICDNSTCT